MEGIVKGSDTLALRAINIDNWDSPVARQFNIRQLPYFQLYDPDGNLAAAGDQAFAKIMNWKD